MWQRSYPPSNRPPLEGDDYLMDDDGAGDGASKDAGNAETTKTMGSKGLVPKCHYVISSFNLGTYDGSTCLAAFLANVKNFELFHLHTCLWGLWDLGPDVALAEFTHLLQKQFGTSDQAEQFQMELQTWRHRAGKELQSLYNGICRLMLLAYP